MKPQQCSSNLSNLLYQVISAICKDCVTHQVALEVSGIILVKIDGQLKNVSTVNRKTLFFIKVIFVIVCG